MVPSFVFCNPKLRDGTKAINPFQKKDPVPYGFDFRLVFQSASIDWQPAIRCLSESTEAVQLHPEAPVDRFSLRPDQTPYRAISRKGWPITTS